MANPTAPFGLRPVRLLTGAPFTGQVNEYEIPASETNAMFIGDVVITNGTSNATDGTPQIVRVDDNSAAGTTANVRGAITGFQPTFSNLSLQYKPASTLLRALVADDFNTIFEVMVTGTLVAGDISSNMKYVNGTGSTFTGLSGGAAKQSTATSSDETLRVLRLAPIVNNLLGASSVVEVLINDHELKSTTGT